MLFAKLRRLSSPVDPSLYVDRHRVAIVWLLADDDACPFSMKACGPGYNNTDVVACVWNGGVGQDPAAKEPGWLTG